MMFIIILKLFHVFIFFSPKENPSSLMAETSILFMYLDPLFVKAGPYKSLSYSK